MKLEAVILAAGSGSRMAELTRSKPKCLLPVGNKCLIWFAITNLRIVGVNRILILVPDTYETIIRQYCTKEFGSYKNLNLEFCSVATKEDLGTAESIFNIKDKIRDDFVVYSCDSVVDSKSLMQLVNHYRLYDPMLTMLLSDNPKYFERRNVPGRTEKESFLRDIIALEAFDKLNLAADDGYSSGKVVFLHSERDMKQKLSIKSRELALHPSLEIHSRLLDTHIYIFKHAMLDFMADNSDRAFLKAEVIPQLISKQFSTSKSNEARGYAEDDDFNSVKSLRTMANYELELKEVLENFNPHNVVNSTCFQRINIPIPSLCHAIVIKNSPAYRVNNLGSYLDCNRDAKALLNKLDVKDFNTMRETVVGDEIKTGEKCMIKKGSVGNNCTIGDRVKLIDCIVMDDVKIESDCNLTDCIISSNSKIGSKCTLKSCLVNYTREFLQNRKAISEVITDDVIDIDDLLRKSGQN